jgi:hypothetical protein
MATVMDLQEFNDSRWGHCLSKKHKPRTQKYTRKSTVSWRNVEHVKPPQEEHSVRMKGHLSDERLRIYEARLDASKVTTPVEVPAEEMFAPGATECECGKPQSRLCRTGKCSVSLALTEEQQRRAKRRVEQAKSQSQKTPSPEDLEHKTAEARRAIKQHKQCVQRITSQKRMSEKAQQKKQSIRQHCRQMF